MTRVILLFGCLSIFAVSLSADSPKGMFLAAVDTLSENPLPYVAVVAGIILKGWTPRHATAISGTATLAYLYSRYLQSDGSLSFLALEAGKHLPDFCVFGLVYKFSV